MSNVLFITPNFGGMVREEPVGTLLLATILRKADISVEVLPFHRFGKVGSFEDFLSCACRTIAEKNPRVISFYTRCDTYHISLRIAERIKESLKDIYIVFAGPQADLSSEDTMREVPYVDFICCGEGETTIVPFFTSLIAGNPDLTISGLVYRSGGDIVKNPRPDLLPDLDVLPAIDYSLLDFRDDEDRINTLFPVDVRRGCPFGCTYCSTKTFWGRKFRLKSAERIVEEIKEIHNRYGVTRFNFEHDMFTMNRGKVIKVCEMLKNIGFPIRWRCSARLDCVDEELIDIMIDAGMEILYVGIETGSPRMQKLIQKNLNLDNVVDKIKYISDRGILVFTSFIFGFPNETEDDFSQTMDLMMQISYLPHVILQHHLFAFFAGTELTKEYCSGTVRSSVLSDVTGEVAVKECENLINAHPALFPHFFEYRTEFREKVKYYPEFFRCWKAMRPVYAYISTKYDKKRLCDMLYDFSKSNATQLDARVELSELLENDRFIDLFCTDEHYGIIKEAARFLRWKINAENGSREVFGIDVKALLDGVDISKLSRTIVMVSCAKNKDGKDDFIIRRFNNN